MDGPTHLEAYSKAPRQVPAGYFADELAERVRLRRRCAERVVAWPAWCSLRKPAWGLDKVASLATLGWLGTGLALAVLTEVTPAYLEESCIPISMTRNRRMTNNTAQTGASRRSPFGWSLYLKRDAKFLAHNFRVRLGRITINTAKSDTLPRAQKYRLSLKNIQSAYGRALGASGHAAEAMTGALAYPFAFLANRRPEGRRFGNIATQRSPYANSGNVYVVHRRRMVGGTAAGPLAQLMKEASCGQELLKRLTVDHDSLAHIQARLTTEVRQDCEKNHAALGTEIPKAAT